MPATSIIVPTYNCGRFLRESLDSLFAQTDRDREVIVVDDGSTDDTSEVLAAYAERVTVVQGAHGGISSARNLGLARAQGEWIAFHDADDVATADRLAWSHAFLRAHPEFDAVFANGARMDDPATRVVPARYGAQAAGGALTVVDLFEGFPVYFQGAVVPRRAFERGGPFDPSYRVQPDLEYGYRLLSSCRAAVVDRVVFHYRWHTTNNSGDRIGTSEDIIRVLEGLPGRLPGVARAIGRTRIQHRIARHHFRLGRVHLRRGEPARARDHFGRAATLRPLHPRYQWMRWRTGWHHPRPGAIQDPS